LALLLGPMRAGAQSFAETIHSYDSALTIESNGDVLVVETINYDFSSTPHHGIDRFVPASATTRSRRTTTG
jgi:hypothetical protein